jgi:hypothetical protein
VIVNPLAQCYRGGVTVRSAVIGTAAVATLASLIGAVPAAGAAPPPGYPVIVPDVTGDVAIDRWPDPNQPIAEPRADLTSAGIKVGPTDLRLTATVAQFANPTQDYLWTQRSTWTQLRWWIDVTADGGADYFVVYGYEPDSTVPFYASLADARDATGHGCRGTPSYDAAAKLYVASFAITCLPARQMRVVSRIDLDLDPLNHYAGVAVDFAPDQPNWLEGPLEWSGPAVRAGVRADRPAVFRSGRWYLRSGVGAGDRTVTSFSYGRATDKPIFCDWDGDGDRTPGVFRDGRWYIRNTNTGGIAEKSFSFGRAGDIPVCGKWPNWPNPFVPDRPGVYRAGTWYLRYSLTGGTGDHTLKFGDAGSIPLVGDWNGDGFDQPGVFRSGRWQLVESFWALVDPYDGLLFSYGRSGDLPVVGDWDRDGVLTIGVKRGATWYVSNTFGGPSSSFGYGLSTDRPLAWR